MFFFCTAALLFSYPHSQLSLCVWDVGTLEMVTLAIWTQDEEVVCSASMAAAKAAASDAHARAAQAALKGSTLMHMTKSCMVPMLRVDPSSRCAALVTYDNSLNIFDLSHAAAVSVAQAHAAAQTTAGHGEACQSGVTTYDTAASTLSTTAGAGLLPSLSQPSTYTLDSLQLGTIKDMQFLHGFEDPTLLILHEKRHALTDHATVTVLGNQELTAVTFHSHAVAFSVIGHISDVSCDTLSIHPIPMPLGGALLFARNTIWHWNNNMLDYALSLNALGGERGLPLVGAGKLAHVEQSTHVLTLDLSYAVFLHTYMDKISMFIVCKNGESYLLNVTPSGQGVRCMQLEALGLLPVPHGIVKVVGRATAADETLRMQSMSSSSPHAVMAQMVPSFLFVVSRMGPSLLLEYRCPTEGERLRQEEEEEVREQMKEIAAAATAATGVPLTTTTDDNAKPASNSTHMGDLSADDTPFDTEEIEATNQRTFADRDVHRGTRRNDFHFFVRDRLACSSAAPIHDISLGHLLPPEEDAAFNAEEHDQALADDAAKRLERDASKAASDDEERMEQALELVELEKRWRDKERCSRVVEVVQLCGFESSGTVVLSNEGIVPDIVAKLEFEHKCTGCWTLRGGDDSSSSKSAAENDGHAFLLITTSQSTLVFRIGDTISQVLDPTQALDQAYTEFLESQGLAVDWVEVKGTREAQESTGVYAVLTPAVRAKLTCDASQASQHPFATARTVAAADVSARREGQDSDSSSGNEVWGVVQVLSGGVRLVQGGQLVEERPLVVGNSNADHPLEYVSAQFESPYIVLRLSDSSIRLVTVRASGGGVLSLGEAEVPSLNSALDQHSASAFVLFKDETQTRALKSLRPDAASAAADGSGAVGMDIDADGGAALSAVAAAVVTPPQPINEMDELELGIDAVATTAAVVPPDHYMAVARNACVEIYSLPSLELVYSMSRFSVGRRVLHHTPACAALEQNGTNGASPVILDALGLHLADSDLPPVVDMFLGVVSDAPEALPVLMAFLDNGDMLAYQSFVAMGATEAPELRWVREQTPLLSRPFLNTTDNPLMGSVMAPASSSLHGGGGKEPTQTVEQTYRDVFGMCRSRRSGFTAATPSRFQRMTHIGVSNSSQDGRRTGVVIAGTKPLCVFADRGALRMHPLVVNWRARGKGLPFEEEEDVEADFVVTEGTPGPVFCKKEGLVCSAPFHYWLRDDDGVRMRSFGFVYFDTLSTMYIAKLYPATPLPFHSLHMSAGKMQRLGMVSPLLATLDCTEASSLSPAIGISPALVDYDTSCLLRRTVHLGATPRFLVRHTPTSTTAVVVSRRVCISPNLLKSTRSVPVYTDRFELLLFHSHSWELMGRYDRFDTHEILTATAVTMHGVVYIALGTSVYQGEDVTKSGQILLFDVFFTFKNARTEAGANDVSPSGSAVAGEGGECEEGGADAVDRVKLLKIRVYIQEEQFPVSKLVSMAPNMLVAGAVNKVILYAHNGSQLISRAFFDGQMWITSLVCFGSFILYGDAHQCLHLLYYDAVLHTLIQLDVSQERLRVTARDFLVGERAGHMKRLWLRSLPVAWGEGDATRSIVVPTAVTGPDQQPAQNALLVCSYAGDLAQLLPSDQMSLQRLTTLSMHLQQSLSQIGDPYPLGMSQFRHPQLSEQVLNLSLLLHFPGLDVEAQLRIARLIDTTPAQIIDNLKRIAWATQMY